LWPSSAFAASLPGGETGGAGAAAAAGAGCASGFLSCASAAPAMNGTAAATNKLRNNADLRFLTALSLGWMSKNVNVDFSLASIRSCRESNLDED
jgi:hypothetical protein